MVEKKPVSLTLQTIFCLIPVLDMYAAYRVKKLRKYLLIMILLVAVPMTIIDSVLFPVNNPDMMEGFYEFLIFFYGVDDNHFLFSIITWVGSVLIAIYLVRHWSKQWNNQLEGSTNLAIS